MASYRFDLTLREARQQYFDANGFNNGGYDDKWVRLKAGPIRLYFPNIDARVRSVKLHDLHHVATEYETTWTGEAEIGAWEIASGCGRHWVAWLLNFAAFAIGLFIAPRLTFRAFVRGRHTANLYGGAFQESLLDRTVGDLRQSLHLAERKTGFSPSDVISFAFWSAIALIVSGAPYIAGALLLIWIVLR